MKKLSIALLLSCAVLSAGAVEGKILTQVVKNEVVLKPGQKIAVASDSGKLTVSSSESDTFAYRVEFLPNKTGWLDFSKGPTEKDYDECTAVYTPEGGLKISTGKGLNAIVTVSVPAKNALDAQLSAGILTIGPRAGLVEAFVGDGILEYDASALGAGVCVTATINAGTVKNKRDFNCKSVGAVLHGHSGLITVK